MIPDQGPMLRCTARGCEWKNFLQSARITAVFPLLYNQRFARHPEENELQQAEIGIIGGSGLYAMPGLTDVREVLLDTPFGAPSDVYVLGTLARP